ncbi:hypothetical protein [Pseudoalteromonas byunsanensis]|uniref:Uncharacterized protein n=1 Tax=Pseudoalteromonas byunsanensis TaxID=327939 RepID=A0A1S1N3N6_9GAMM|nr:hypothetical protein [Pseudoalteromonas byunsanensis]OHU94018.1 hypothetical protein BIW53_17515 [Pseudoalteromonas byunsanensis]
MSINEIEKQILLKNMNKQLQLENELEKLRPSVFYHCLKAIIICALAFAWGALVPSVSDEITAYLLLYGTILMGVHMCYENYRTNKRIDTLYKLLKRTT